MARTCRCHRWPIFHRNADDDVICMKCGREKPDTKPAAWRRVLAAGGRALEARS